MSTEPTNSPEPHDSARPTDDAPAEATAPLWTQYAPTTPPPAAPATAVLDAGHPAGKPDRSKKGLAVVLGATGLAAIVGAAAGVGGSAFYLHEHPQSHSSVVNTGNGSSSPIVQSGGSADETTIEKVAAAVLPSVVKIEAQGGKELGTGSGIILSADGKILTNNHVVDFAAKGGRIRVDFNNGTFANATVLGTDPLTDTAVIQAQGVSGLHPLSVGKSSALQVGQSVLAIGSPYGLDATVTSGIVSALNRPTDVTQDNSSNRTVYPAIQTDAAINPGNSGGPLVDLSGRLVGINASIRASDSASGSGGQSGSIGLGFAIPIDAVLPIVAQLEQGQTATHAKLGVSVGNAGGKDAVGTTDGDVLFGASGAKIDKVGDGSAAGKAGLQNGDIITKVDSHAITDSDSLVATIRAYRPGDKVTVTYVRGGQVQTAQVTLDSDASSSTS